MRTLSILVLAVSLAVAAATAEIVELLCNLDRQPALELIRTETLLRGDLYELYLLPLTWQYAPGSLLTPHYWAMLGTPRAFLPMLLITGMIVCVCYRRRSANYTAAGVCCLLGAAVPWAFGVAMLGRIRHPDEAGPWILLMIGSVFWGALVCGGGACWHLVSLRREPNQGRMAQAAVPA